MKRVYISIILSGIVIFIISLFEIFTSEVYAVTGATNLKWDNKINGRAIWSKNDAAKFKISLYCNGKEIYYTNNTYFTTPSKDFGQYILPGNSYKFRVYSYTSDGKSLGTDDSDIYTLGGSLGQIYNLKIFKNDNLAVTWNSISDVTGYEIILKKAGKIVRDSSISPAEGNSQYFDLKNILPEAGLGSYTITINAYKYSVGNNVATVSENFEYDEQRTVTFKDKNTVLNTIKVNHWAKVQRPTNPYKNGYTFVDWYYDYNCAEKFNFNDYTKYNTIIYAKFMPNVYTITYNLDGGKQLTPNPSTYTIETPTFVLNAPVKEGYAFSEWINPYGNPIENGNTIKKGTIGNLTLKAIWKKIHKVTYDLNGGTSTGNISFTKIDGEKINFNDIKANIINANIVTPPTNKEFDAFEINGTRWNNGDYTIKKDTIIKILWKNKVPIVQHIVIFKNGIDNSTINTVQVKDGQKVTKPSEPYKNGYTFDNWYEDSKFIKKFDFNNTIITKDTTIYAKFIKQCNITINYNGGTNNRFMVMPLDAGTVLNKSDIELSFKDSSIIVPPSGKEYAGIEINGTKWTASTYTLNSDITMKILWKDKASTKVLLGDLNENGKVEANDAFLALQLSVSGKKPTTKQLQLGDIDGNSKVDAFDAYQILAYSVGIKDAKYWK